MANVIGKHFEGELMKENATNVMRLLVVLFGSGPEPGDGKSVLEAAVGVDGSKFGAGTRLKCL